jgi:large subunit ribosomal protein L2
MGIKKLKPVTSGTRFRSNSSFEEITKSSPEKSLTVSLKKSGGRNNLGRVTTRFIGGGHKRRYRIIDFKRSKHGIPAKVFSIEYDPNRTSRIALLHYLDGEKKYIIAPEGLKVGDKIVSGPGSDINIGNALPLKEMPLGSFVHNVEIKPGKGGQLGRSAGSSLQLLAKEGGYAQLKMPSGEIRMIRLDCLATYGMVGNAEQENISLGKAGRSRWLGIRHPVSPWGQKAKGLKTRKHKKESNKFIIKRRK